MREIINAEVSVMFYFDAKRKHAAPYLIDWHGRQYRVGEIGFHHTIWNGETLHHIYELTDQEQVLSMRLNFNTKNLHWVLEAVSDGLAE